MNKNCGVTIGLYRHFKGQYFYVTNVCRSSEDENTFRATYFNLCHPEQGYFSRPCHEFFSETDKMAQDDSGEWFDCGESIKERWDNATGQSHRFERVRDLNYQLGSILTEQLVWELRQRKDSPIHELDIEGLKSDVFSRDWCIGIAHEQTEDTPKGVETLSVFDTEEEAGKYLSTHQRSRRERVFKRVFIECGE